MQRRLEVVARLERDLWDEVAEVEGGRRPRLVVFPVPVARRGQGRSGRRRQGLLRRRRRPLEVPAANFIVQSQKSKVRYARKVYIQSISDIWETVLSC